MIILRLLSDERWGSDKITSLELCDCCRPGLQLSKRPMAGIQFVRFTCIPIAGDFYFRRRPLGLAYFR